MGRRSNPWSRVVVGKWRRRTVLGGKGREAAGLGEGEPERIQV
jgi:hypothetical protein